MNDHASLFFRGFISAIVLFNLVGSGAVFGEDSHAGSDPKTLIIASARPTRSGTADNGSLISLPDNSGKSTKQTKSSNTTAATAQPSKYPRPNEMLQGVVYDLKRTKDLKPTDLIGGSVTNMEKPVDGNVFASITKPFVNGADSTWRNTTDNRGGIRYPYFDTNYYCLPSRLWNSYFFLQYTDNNDIPKLLHADTSLQGGGWIAIYSGYVVAPFSGMFRFVGFSDDSMLVRFNKDIVLDYGWYSLTMGVRLSSFSSNYVDLLRGRVSPTAEQKSKLQESPLFSKFKTDILPVECDEGNSHGLQKHGLQRGIPIKVQKGQVIPIEIILSEQGDGGFSSMLFVEQLDDKGKPYKTYPDKLPLFRTTAHLPSHPTLNWFPDFEDNGPIWKVVDSFGKPIPASKYAKQDVKIGFQLDDGIETKQQTVASATTTKPKTTAPVVNEEDELPGVLYDLKQTSNGESTGLLEMQEGKQFNLNRMRTMLSVWNLPDTAGKESLMVPYLKRFVVSNWPHKTDSTGQLFFNEFNQFSRSPVNSYRSYFYQPIISSANAPKSYSGDGRVSDGGWVAINSGYVVAPFTGKFRFVGCGDDALVVRFNNQIVLDYGCYALSLGKKLDGTWDYKAILGGTAAKTDPQNRMVLNNPVYSQCKLETYFPSVFASYGLAKGVPISVTKGKHYPIQVLVTDIEKGNFGTALLIERLDSTGVPLKKDPAKLPLFRTSSALPGHSSGSGFPDFDEDSPIWRVVDSNGKSIPSHKQGSKLVVTTVKDVVNPNDGLTSIREAISYAKTLGGVQTISFNMSDGDNVTISDPKLIYHELRFASVNEATGNAVTVTLEKMNISGRSYSSAGNDFTIIGGAVLHVDGSNILVSGGVYANNRDNSPDSVGYGGVIRMNGGTLTVDGAVFNSNYTRGSGGAVNCDSPTNVTIRNTHFENNSVSGGGGGLILWKIPASHLIDTDFIGNSALSNKQDSDWSGGAIRIYETNLVYEVTAGKTITNINNDSRIGGFIALTGPANVEFKVNGTLNIGNGNGKDSFETQSSSQNVSIRKTGSGTMMINAPVSDYKGTWTVEDGVLNMNYGGSFAGLITVNGGRISFNKDYTFTRLVIGLDAKKKDAYVGGANHLSGGKYCISIDTAIPEGSYLLAEGVKGIKDPVVVQTKDGTSLGTLSVGRETIICDGSCTLTLDGGKLSLSVLSPINPVKKVNTDTNPNAQTQRDPNLKKVVSTTTRGNITTQTVTEYNGDTTIETVTTTEVNGDTTTITTETTESRKGFVVKKTTTTTTTTGNQPASQSSNQSETEKAAGNSSSETNTTPKKNNPTYNPFGYTSPLMED